MKNRKTSSHDNLIVPKPLSDTSKSQSDIRNRRKSSANSFLKKSAEIFQSYRAIFNKPTLYNIGDADTFFRHSLRNYDDFEIANTLKWNQKHLKPDKSVECFKLPKETDKNKFQTSSTLAQGDARLSKHKHKHSPKRPYRIIKPIERKQLLYKQFSVKHESLKVSVVPRPDEEETAEETELDVFYSPNSQLQEHSDDSAQEVSFYAPSAEAEFNSESNTEKFKSITEVVESDKNCIMADDELQEVENLVQQAGSELNEVVAENPDLQEALGQAENEEAVEITVSEMPVRNEGLEIEALDSDAVDDGIPESEAFQSEGLESEQLESEATEAQEKVEDSAAEVTESNLYGSEKLVTDTDDEADIKMDPPTVTTTAGGEPGPGKTVMGYDPNIDASVIKELEDAERQAMETAKIIYELKQRVAQLLGKSKMTEVEGRELEEKNRQLREQMSLFEAKTKRIQFLVDQANLFENMLSPRPALGSSSVSKKHTEDMLPKVIICGMTENNMPKIIVCDDKKMKQPSSGVRKPSYTLPPPVNVMPQFAKRLSESYYMQERLAAENADLEGKRYKLQEDLFDKDQTVESLQRKLNSLQGEMRMVCKENSLLTDKLQQKETCPASCHIGDIEEPKEQPSPTCKKHQKKSRMPCGKNKGPCPAEVETRLQEYSETTHQLEKQLSEMETEVRTMQNELVAVQQERQHLEQHRRMICVPTCAPPPCVPTCAPPPCAPSPCAPPPCAKPPCQGPCNPSVRKGGGSGSVDQQLRELREQYNRLQDDFKGKLTEVAGLRADNEKLKQTTKEAEESRKAAEDKMKEYEKELKGYKMQQNKFMGSKEQLVEQEQQLNVAKQRFREAQDELEELRALVQDQQAQLDDYRNKYLQAQQQVEEQRRQIDMMEMENNRISEQVNLEIQRVKNQFQEKLQELTPLPDILKATQIKLQEAQQLHLLAERNNESLVHELQAYRDKAAAMADQMERVRSDQQLGADEKATLGQQLAESERKLIEAQEEADGLKTELARMEEIAEQNEKRVQEKLHEITQLMSQLETVREESARQVARTKDRCETVRRSMQNQIADLERQLAQSRAQARTAQKDRDDIRQKMQSQINNLNENFEDAQMRIRNLQGHVNFLKNSYTTVFPPSEGIVSDGMDACDCGNAY